MNTVVRHKIQCPNCKHEFDYKPFQPLVDIPGIIGFPFIPEYECPKCHYKFHSFETKRRKPSSLWDSIKSIIGID